MTCNTTIKHFIFTVLYSISIEAQANSFDIYATGGIWQAEYSGSVIDSASASNSINLKDDLSLENAQQNFFYICMEQPLVGVPNIRIGRSIIKTRGESILTKNVLFQGDSYSINEKIITKLNLEHIEFALYWKTIDVNDSLDLGFAIKEFAGDVSLKSTTSNTATLVLSQAIPLLYSGYKKAIPLTAFTVGFNISFLSVNKAYLYDTLIFVRYQAESHIGIEAGYRNFQLGVDSNTVKTNIVITGLYLNALVYF